MEDLYVSVGVMKDQKLKLRDLHASHIGMFSWTKKKCFKKKDFFLHSRFNIANFDQLPVPSRIGSRPLDTAWRLSVLPKTI